MDLLEAAYGWRNLTALAAACGAGQISPGPESTKENRRAG
jgi:hypothetical protein